MANKNQTEPNGRILIVTAVDAEREAVLRGIGADARFDVIAAGVGPAAAAAGTALALAADRASHAPGRGFQPGAVGSQPAPANTASGGGPVSAESAVSGGKPSPSGISAAASSPSGSPLPSGRPLGGQPDAAGANGASYRLVVSAGIAGGFPGLAPVGSLVVASEIVAADLGAETADGFASVDELGFGSARIGVDARLASELTAAIAAAGLTASTGPVLTVSTATGSAATAAEHMRRVPGAAAEAMEGFGVATAAQQFGLPALELRAISNAVGPRNRDAWRIGDALRALERASQILKEVLA